MTSYCVQEKEQTSSPYRDPISLAHFPLFEPYSHEQLTQLYALCSYRTCCAGTILMRAHEHSHGACFLTSGTVKVHVEQADGKNVILAILGPGQFIGELSLSDTRECSATVVTREPTTLLWIDRLQFSRAVTAMPILQDILIRTLSSRLRLANMHIQALATLSTHDRIVRQLAVFAQEYGQQVEQGIHIPVRLTHDDLADLVGATRVHVSRLLGDWKRHGLLSTDRHHRITIHDLTQFMHNARTPLGIL